MMPAVLFAIHDQARRGALRDAAHDAGYRVHTAATLAEARRVLADTHVDVAFVDETLDATGDLAHALRRRQTTPRARLVRLLAPAAGASAAARAWRPDASLRADMPVETALTLLQLLAPTALVPSPST